MPMNETCAWCQCRAVTSRDGQPACWWCAEAGLDDVPCSTCRASRIRPEADAIEAALRELDGE